MTSIQINLRSAHEPLFSLAEGPEEEGIFVHASLDGRFPEAVAACAIARAVNGALRVAIVTPESDHILSRLRRWLASSGAAERLEVKVADGRLLAGWSFATGGEVWVMDQDTTKARAQVRNPDLVFYLPADKLQQKPLPYGKRRIFLSEMPDRAHWTYALLSTADVEWVPAERILECFPDQAEEALAENDPFYRRKMLLEDAEVVFETESLERFIGSRLFIKTDKHVDLLTVRQQEAAASQLEQRQRIVPFDIHSGQVAYLERKKRILEERGGKPWVIVLKSRRVGITAIEQALSYRMANDRPFSDVVTLAHKRESTQRIFNMVSMFHERDPKRHPLRNKGSKSALELANGSNFFIGTAGGEGFLRGDGVSRVHWSEVAKSCPGPQQSERVADLWAGISGAASNGEIVLESTANGREWFWSQWIDAKNGDSELKPVFLRWFDDPMNRLLPSQFDSDELRDTLLPVEEELMERHQLDLEQIAFRRQMVRIYKRLTPQEMPEDDTSCFLSSGICFFDGDALVSALERIAKLPPPRLVPVSGGTLKIWEDPQPKVKYVMGVDTSEGIPGGDYAGFTIIRHDTGQQVADLHGHWRPGVLGELCVKWGRHYNDALMGVERENHGHAVVQKVMECGRPYNISHLRNGRLFFGYSGGEVRGSGAPRSVQSMVDTGRPGWSTNPSTRDPMLDAFADAFHQGAVGIMDASLIEEMGAFNLQSNGKYSADSMAHDDRVMKTAIAWAMRSVRIPTPSLTTL